MIQIITSPYLHHLKYNKFYLNDLNDQNLMLFKSYLNRAYLNLTLIITFTYYLSLNMLISLWCLSISSRACLYRAETYCKNKIRN